MPEDNYIREGSTRQGTTGKHSFDELAKGLAGGTVTRGQAMKLVGAAILGTTLTSLFTRQASAQSVSCPEDLEPCGNTCCGVTEECCGGTICCGPTEECCAGVCCEPDKVCVDGQCVCAAGSIPCGSTCCNAVTEICVDGQCRNPFCESCAGQCCQVVDGSVLIDQACCTTGDSTCTRAGVGCICCPRGTRCPRLAEAFACVRV
jgi:hypothetical protein